MLIRDSAPFKRWGYSWLALVFAFAIHVVDEALTGFLPRYNAVVTQLREAYAFFPLPTFTFPAWIGGLTIAIIILLLLSPLVFSGRRSMRYVSYVLSVLMILNGLGHIGISLYSSTIAPGTISSPILILASILLLVSAKSAP